MIVGVDPAHSLYIQHAYNIHTYNNISCFLFFFFFTFFFLCVLFTSISAFIALTTVMPCPEKSPYPEPVLLGVIGGSGVGKLDCLQDAQQLDLVTPFGKPSAPITVAKVSGFACAFLPRHGTNYNILPSEVNNAANIYAFKMLGVRYVLAINAVGSLSADYRPGDLVLVDQLIDKTFRRRTTFFGDGVVAFTDFAFPFSTQFRDIAFNAMTAVFPEASSGAFKIHKAATIVTMEGPQFSTKAESLANKAAGGHLIGMTTAPEAKLAREAEMAYCTVAMVTDMDAWSDEPHVDVSQVMATMAANSSKAQKFPPAIIGAIQKNLFEDPAHNALKFAVMTKPEIIPRETKEKLYHLLGAKYEQFRSPRDSHWIGLSCAAYYRIRSFAVSLIYMKDLLPAHTIAFSSSRRLSMSCLSQPSSCLLPQRDTALGQEPRRAQPHTGAAFHIATASDADDGLVWEAADNGPATLLLPPYSVPQRCFSVGRLRLSPSWHRRAKTDVPFTDYSTKPCPLRVCWEVVRPVHPHSSPQIVLARWPADATRCRRRLETVLSASRLQFMADPDPKADLDVPTRTPDAPPTGETLYWPAAIRDCKGVLEGPLFQPSGPALSDLLLVEWDVVRAAAEQAPMRITLDVLFAADEVTEAIDLSLTPLDNTPLPGSFPDVVSCWNASLEGRDGADAPPFAVLRRPPWLQSGPHRLNDMLAGPICQSQCAALLQPSPAVVAACRAGAIAAVRCRWEAVRASRGVGRRVLEAAALRLSRIEGDCQPSERPPRPPPAPQDDGLVPSRPPRLQTSAQLAAHAAAADVMHGEGATPIHSVAAHPPHQLSFPQTPVGTSGQLWSSAAVSPSPRAPSVVAGPAPAPSAVPTGLPQRQSAPQWSREDLNRMDSPGAAWGRTTGSASTLSADSRESSCCSHASHSRERQSHGSLEGSLVRGSFTKPIARGGTSSAWNPRKPSSLGATRGSRNLLELKSMKVQKVPMKAREIGYGVAIRCWIGWRHRPTAARSRCYSLCLLLYSFSLLSLLANGALACIQDLVPFMASDAAVADGAAMEQAHTNGHLLYHHALIPSQQVLHAVEGSFTLPNAHDMVLVRHRTLELWTLHPQSGRMECVHATPLFTDVYAAVAVPTGVTTHRRQRRADWGDGVARDGVEYLAVTSETGYATLLRYELETPPVPARVPLDGTDATEPGTTVVATSLRGTFIKVSEVLLGRSGARVAVPGMRMTADEHGTALFITALMRCKVVVPVERTNVDAAALRTVENMEESDEDDSSEGEAEAAAVISVGRKRRRPRRANGVITLGSPIEVHRQTVIYAVCAIHSGEGGETLFAALEEDIVEVREEGGANQQQNPDGAFVRVPGAVPSRRKALVVYSYAASLRQVQRTQLMYPPPTAHRLISLPAAPCGPGGVLVCTDVEMMWYDLSSAGDLAAGLHGGSTGVFRCSTAFPRRDDFPETAYDPSIVAHALTSVAGNYFLLVQDEHGDLYRVSISASGVKAAKDAWKTQRERTNMGTAAAAVRTPLAVHYYETIPPSKTMALFRRGFLFAASDGGPTHVLYRVKDGYTSEKDYIIKRIKATTDHKGPGGRLPLPPPSAVNKLPPAPTASRTISTFEPHKQLQHLDAMQEMPNTPPITAMNAVIPGDGGGTTGTAQQQQVQITAACGRGPMSTLVQARYGHATRQMNCVRLPTAYISIVPLSSATALCEYRALQENVAEQAAMAQRETAAAGTKGPVSATLRRLAAVASQYSIETDRVLVSTLKATAVYRIGQQVELDSETMFERGERTLAACTLQDGKGYLQVTVQGIHVVPASHITGASPERWTDPKNRTILAAAAAPYGAVVAFAGGGIASFDLNHGGAALAQRDAQPAVRATAVALLQPPASVLTSDVYAELRALLFHQSLSTRERNYPELAAVATTSREVLLLMPRSLHKPLDIIQSRAGIPGHCEIRSVLLTYLAEHAGEDPLASRTRRPDAERRLFCFVGYTDGILVRCEVDRSTGKVAERQELVCGSQPCQMIAGDGETMCYVQCGQQCWRCSIRSGVPKVTPWRFPSRQTAFARFAMPSRPQHDDGDSEAIRLGAVHPQEEAVISLRDRELLLFAAQHAGSGPNASLEYSLVAHSLPLAGRRIVRHPTRPSFLLVAGTEHRGYSRSAMQQRTAEDKPPVYAVGQRRSLHKPGQYNSTLQFFHEESNALLPPYLLPDGDAIMSITSGSFTAAMGKEPIIVAGVASRFTHGDLCGAAPSYREGSLRAFRSVPVGGGEANELRLEPLHSTLLQSPGSDADADYASALHVCEEVGLLIVGLGRANGLRLYSCGRNQFLLKRRLKNVPARITALDVIFRAPPTIGAARSFFVRGLYQCPPDNAETRRRVSEKQMLVVCGTDADSVFIAALQPESTYFLMIVARDTVPRRLTCMTVIDEQTIAVADRFGSVAFLQIPPTARTTFAEPVEVLTEAELTAISEHAGREQLLEEVASHHTGQLVTSIQVQSYDPSGGADPTVATRIVLYGTSLGAVGCYTPFVAEADGALAAYARPLLRDEVRLLLHPGEGRLPFHWTQHRGQGHNVVEGEWLEAFRQTGSTIFPAAAKEDIEAQLNRIRATERQRRAQLQLPPRVLPTLDELVAKQRALSTLPL
eukprot:gene8447-5925_t